MFFPLPITVKDKILFPGRTDGRTRAAMKPGFVFEMCTIATFETLRNLYGYGHYEGQRIEHRGDPLLLVLLLSSLLLVYFAFPNWE